MGYKAKLRTYDLPLGEEFDGLEVTARGVTVGKYLRLVGADGEPVPLSYAIEEFARALVSWNLVEDDGTTPVPATAEAVQALDKDLVLAMSAVWLDCLNGRVPRPLESSSPDGGPSPEAQIPMDVQSGHPPS